ncbi:hypothetical protein B0H17DRAFT_935502, partial [Mycena rosella]
MTAEKIIEAYIAASGEAEAIREDEVATSLFDGYRTQALEEINNVPHKVFANVLVEPAKRYKDIRGSEQEGRTWHSAGAEAGCDCEQLLGFACPESPAEGEAEEESVSVFAGKKYKPVGLKVRPVYTELPDQYRIRREIKGDPLEGMPVLNPQPSEFVPKGRYTLERKEELERRHEGFLWPEE